MGIEAFDPLPLQGFLQERMKKIRERTVLPFPLLKHAKMGDTG
jgi:hypothetical protein